MAWTWSRHGKKSPPWKIRTNGFCKRKSTTRAFVPTVDGQKSKAEIRMMFVWPDNDRNPTLVNNLVRMSQGKMMGVDFNVEKTWVGASIALHEA